VVKTNPSTLFHRLCRRWRGTVPRAEDHAGDHPKWVRLQTKVQWYQFRLEGINDLYAGITERGKESLERLLAEIMAEPERGRAAVVEIVKCELKALAKVKSSIADNATQLRMLGEEVADIQKDINGSNKRRFQQNTSSLRAMEAANIQVLTVSPCVTDHPA
jgi:hypothetical protein